MCFAQMHPNRSVEHISACIECEFEVSAVSALIEVAERFTSDTAMRRAKLQHAAAAEVKRRDLGTRAGSEPLANKPRKGFTNSRKVKHQNWCLGSPA